jgi:hypothetical protein
MSAGVAIVTSCALIGAALKLAGPVLLGGRSMPESFSCSRRRSWRPSS